MNRSTSVSGFAISTTWQADIQDRLEDAISDSSLILFTTTALDPYLADERTVRALSYRPTFVAA